MATDETITSVIRTNIRVAMARADVSQKDLGNAIGVSQQGISQRMHGSSRWSVEEILGVAQYLGVPVSELMPDSLTAGTGSGRMRRPAPDSSPHPHRPDRAR